MKAFILCIVILFSFTAWAEERSESVMEMVCLATIPSQTGTSYTGRVFVITQKNTERYDSSVFVDRIPKENGKIIFSTDWVPFVVKKFDNVSLIKDNEEVSDYAASLVEENNFNEIHTEGYRVHAQVGAHYYFDWGDDTLTEFIRYATHEPTSSTYDDGVTGGVLDCLSPYSKRMDLGQ